jgi:putative ABC transport system permease protein
MFRLTIKNLLANKVRFALTTFGVMLAVSFVVSAFVLGDGLRSSFTDVSEDITAGVDIEVRNVADFGDASPLPMSTVDTVATVDGVADAVAVIEAADDAVRPIKANGDYITTQGPPQLAFNWIDNEQLSAFTLVEGSAPEVGEFTIDLDSAAEHGFVIGDSYELIVPDGRATLTLSGTSSFGADNATLGAVLMQINTAEASELFGTEGITNVSVQVADGADAVGVQAAIAAAVPTADVVDHAAVLAETTAEFTDEIDIVGNILLGFGFVALFVSIFIIYNTFAIVLSQRIRELALLRTIGADPRQIKRSVLGEAFVVGVLASVGGIGGGILVAKGLEALFGLMGADLPAYPLILATRTLVAAVAIGIGVTMLAAIGPARRASTVAPITALNGGAEAGAAGSRTRKVSGFGLIGLGALVGAAGLSGVGSTAVTVATMAFGAIAMFLGVTLLSPLAVGVVTGVLGWPMRKLAGVAGHLAQKNAARNSRRTATTAAALMIGLALVSTALVVGESIKKTIGSTFEQTAKAEYYMTDDLGEVEFPAALASEIRQSDVVTAATGFTLLEAKVDGIVADVVGFDFDQIEPLLDLDLQDGSPATNVANPMLVHVDEAEAIGASVGDVLTTEFANGATIETTIVGLFDERAIMSEDYLYDHSVLAAAGVPQTAEWVAISVADDASPVAIDAMVTGLSDAFPAANVETSDEFRERVVGVIDQVLTMVNVMVALAVIIALIGIANTLALSVFERIRELGLVRAVGMSRRQLRRMVRFEAALVATFGAVLGVGLGLFFGWGVATALPASFASTTAIPVVNIVVLMVIAAVAGVIAAWLPARRAGKLNVLDAIAG